MTAEDLAYLSVSVDLPICAVCGRPVDRIAAWHDVFFRQFHFLVECHGQVEECDLPEGLVLNANKIEFGRAFEDRTKSH